MFSTSSTTTPSLYPNPADVTPTAPPLSTLAPTSAVPETATETGVRPSAPAPPAPPSPADTASFTGGSPTYVHSTSDGRHSSESTHSSGGGMLPPDYELLLEIQARIVEVAQDASGMGPSTVALPAPTEGLLRVIQGPLPPSTPEQSHSQQLQRTQPYYHAFISVGEVNIPLLPTCGASRPAHLAYYMSVPEHTFLIQPHSATEPELVDALERLLRWFCHWQTVTGNQAPPPLAAGISTSTNPSTSSLPSSSCKQTNANNGDSSAYYLGRNATAADHAASSMAAVVTAEQEQEEKRKKKQTADRLATVGDKGVLLVEKMGTMLNMRINSALEKRRDRINEENTRQVKMGGKVTASMLSTTRKVVGAGATVASKMSDRISTKVGSSITSNSVARNMASAPIGSAKRSFYDTLMAGALVFGRVYVEADRQGRKIITDTGDHMSDIARKKYGNEAEVCARNLTGIAIDGYRVARFPQKLGASSIVKGAFKSQFAQSSHTQANEPAIPPGAPRYTATTTTNTNTSTDAFSGTGAATASALPNTSTSSATR